MTPAVCIQKLSKRYQVTATGSHDHASSYRTLRDSLSNLVTAPLRRFRNNGSNHKQEDFWALKDVSFDIRPGDVVGIIGRNGAGKSTLLKILSRVTKPTMGQVIVNGRVGSLLEVGTGFHPELTGRENIYLNGSILGMTKAEIKRQFDAIVDFSGVEQFLDTPVKRYSSGMYVRLAFAVAAYLNPEILVVDEVLAVGDAEFQKKCLGKMKDVATSGRTVVFVSHNMHAIRNLCTMGAYFDRGLLVSYGSISSCIEQYLASGCSKATGSWRRQEEAATKPLMFLRVDAFLRGSQPHHVLELAIEIESSVAHKPAFFAADILDASDTAIMQAIPTFDRFIRPRFGRQQFAVSIDLPPLVPGRYALTVWMGSHYNETMDHQQQCVSFEVLDSPSLGRTIQHSSNHGFLVPISRLDQIPH